MSIVRVTAVAASLLVTAVGALATDAPVSGKKLVVRDTPSPRLVFLSRDAVPGPTLTGSDDPTFFGAMLTVVGGSGETVTIDLPASGWRAGGGSFRFRNRAPRKGRNPKTGERVDVPPKKIPYFKMGKELKALLNSAGVASAVGSADSDPSSPDGTPEG